MSTQSLAPSTLLFRYLRPQWVKAMLMTGLLLTSIALQLIDPLVLRNYIDQAQSGGSIATLVWGASIFIVIALVNQVVAAYATYVGQDVGWTATNQLREDIAAHCLHLDMTFLNGKTPGEFIERIDGDLTALANFFSAFVINVLGSFLLIIGVIVLLLRENIIIGAAMSVMFALTTVIVLRVKDLAIPAGASEREANANLFGFIEERLTAIDDIRANGASAYALQRFTDISRALLRKGVHVWMLRSVFWSTIILMAMISTVVMLGLGARLYFLHIISLGTIYLIFQYNDILQGPIELITHQLQDFQKAGASLVRIREVLSLSAEITDGVTGTLPTGPLAVAFDHVDFAYPDDGVPVLQDIDLYLQPGTTLGLLGHTGSGKTTISRLLFRLYDITGGTLRVGGTDIQTLPLHQLRQRVGIVTQDVQLFHASVRDNLTFFDTAISDQHIHAVIREMGLLDWYARLPQGLDTPLHANGAGLSAGEAQLLAFIRIFLKDPGLVILDEPSSRLDPATEKLLAQAMQLLLRNRTGIIIAHRLATVQRADTILILNQGRMQEFGARERLAADPTSQFYTLLHIGAEVVA